eukprot:8938695-Alexandrium_andersonii.AAC.1
MSASLVGSEMCIRDSFKAEVSAARSAVIAWTGAAPCTSQFGTGLLGDLPPSLMRSPPLSSSRYSFTPCPGPKIQQQEAAGRVRTHHKIALSQA